MKGKGLKLYEAATRVIDLLWAGILWILLCLPVITAGASCCAFYYTVVKCIRHERGRTTKSFFSSFASNFKQATACHLCILLYVALGIANAFALGQMRGSSEPSSAVAIIFAIPALVLLPWLFPLISRIALRFGQIWKTALYMSIRHIAQTIVCILLAALTASIAFLVPYLLPILPGPVCIIISFLIEPGLKELTDIIDDTNDDKWYNE